MIVIALGGNALLQRDQNGTFSEQYSNVCATASRLADVVELGYSVVITHGNGPQVGATLLRHDAGYKLYSVPPFPMDVCGAETQGFIGYMIQQALHNEFARRGIKKSIVTLVTRVLVDKNDQAFRNPTKPVGPFYSKEQAEKLAKSNPSLVFKEDSGRGYRRLVPSPDPQKIIESEAISALVRLGHIVISTGGGGIPVIDEGELKGVEAVIDKDLAAQRLASLLGAERLIILTDVRGVFLDYGKSSSRMLSRVSSRDLKEYYERGFFASGSMGPKVLASIRFVESGGKEAVIAHLSELRDALQGDAGTHIVS